jgi:tRNA-splicing ligase RtcB
VNPTKNVRNINADISQAFENLEKGTRITRMSDTHNIIHCDNGVPIHAWTRGVPIEAEAQKQLLNVAQLPFVFRWIAAMPDVHWGIGATVGSVIPTKGAIIPAAVGVDIGCGMMAVQTTLRPGFAEHA